MNSYDKFLFMLEKQDEVNSKVNKEWKVANNDWLLAYRAEIAEIYAHDIRWKWWTKKEWTPEITKDIQLEIVDGWHFLMSNLIIKTITAKSVLAARIDEAYGRILERLSSQKRIAYESVNEWPLCDEALIDALSSTLMLPTRPPILEEKIKGFFTLVYCYGLSFDRLYTLYLAKAVLNNFRQDHGYKQGKYPKLWAGVEDNKVLMDLDVVKENTTDPALILVALDKQYRLIHNIHD